MNPDRPTSAMDAIIRLLRWLNAAFQAVRNTQGLTFQQAMEQLGHDAFDPYAVPPAPAPAPPQAKGYSSPAAGAARTGLARHATGSMKHQAEARAALLSKGTAPAPTSVLAPGEVPNSGSAGWIWTVAALGVGGMLLYRYWAGWSA
jgi:hypothetical protein